ncbi:MAG TPA: response regulator [Hyphomicrobiaceae bacterium]|nr:response regulator [Hyphomicrobiaceae bacterium]
MHQPPLILIADDNDANREILGRLLEARGYHLVMAADGEEALASARSELPDLVLLDVMMPKLDGFEVCQRLKADKALPFMPIILVTARADSKDIVRGLEAGGDEYVTKPIDQAALVARVRSALRIKELHDTVHEQSRRLAKQADELAQWNTTLEQRVQDQLVEIERIGRLRRFLSPQIAELVLSSGGEQLLESHRREITTLNCDLRGFTGFSEIAEPEEVIQVLRQYHETLGALIDRFEATLERYAGDGVMVWFNDPLPCPDPCQRAVHMALQMRTQMAELLAQWRRQGHQLGFSIGIAHGYATLGRIGFEGRFDYAAVGTVVNLAARLCAQAADNQILIDRKVLAVVEPIFLTEPAGEFMLKGLHRPTAAFNVCGVREAETS